MNEKPKKSSLAKGVTYWSKPLKHAQEDISFLLMRVFNDLKEKQLKNSSVNSERIPFMDDCIAK